MAYLKYIEAVLMKKWHKDEYSELFRISEHYLLKNEHVSMQFLRVILR